MKKLALISILMFISSAGVWKTPEVKAKFFDTYSIDFENKYLYDLDLNVLNDKIVYFQFGNVRYFWDRPNPYHSFTSAVLKNRKKVKPLFFLKDLEPTSKQYFDYLKLYLNNKGKKKFLKGFRNYNDQSSQFKRISIVKELRKAGVIAALKAWSEEVSKKGLVSFRPKKLPKYNFNNETFSFSIDIDKKKRKRCYKSIKVSQDKAADLIENSPKRYLKGVYWEALTYESNDSKLSKIDIYLSTRPSSEPDFSFGAGDCY